MIIIASSHSNVNFVVVVGIKSDKSTISCSLAFLHGKYRKLVFLAGILAQTSRLDSLPAPSQIQNGHCGGDEDIKWGMREMGSKGEEGLEIQMGGSYDLNFCAVLPFA